MDLEEKLRITRDYIRSFGEEASDVGKKYELSAPTMGRLISSVENNLSPLEKEMLNQRRGEDKKGYRGFTVTQFMAIAKIYANTPCVSYGDIGKEIGISSAAVMRIVDKCSKPILTEEEIEKIVEKQSVFIKTDKEKMLEIARNYINTNMNHEENADKYNICTATSIKFVNTAKEHGLLSDEEKKKLEEKLAKAPRYGGGPNGYNK